MFTEKFHKNIKHRYLLVITLLVLAIMASLWLSTPCAKVERKQLSEFPLRVGEWKCLSKQKLSPDVMEVLKVDDYIMRSYVNEAGQVINLYIGYFKTQREGKQVHSPRQCLPGAGWYRLKHFECALPLFGSDKGKLTNTSVNVDLMGKGDEKELYVWWYQGRGRIYANEYKNKLYLMWDALTKKRTDGALVRIDMPVEKNLNDALSLIDKFISYMLPVLSQYIPV